MKTLTSIRVIKIAICLVFAISLTNGCVRHCDPQIQLSIEHYNAIKSHIQIGDSFEKVAPLLEDILKCLPNGCKKEEEAYEENNQHIVIIYARSTCFPDGLTTDDEFTPYIFCEGTLRSIGWDPLGGPKTWNMDMRPKINYIKVHPELNPRIKQCIMEEKICTGMTINDVMVSWDHLRWKMLYRSSNGSECWHGGHYESIGSGSSSIRYFDSRWSFDFFDGKLTGWTEFGKY